MRRRLHEGETGGKEGEALGQVFLEVLEGRSNLLCYLFLSISSRIAFLMGNCQSH